MRKRICENCERMRPAKKVAVYKDVELGDGTKADIRLCADDYSCARCRIKKYAGVVRRAPPIVIRAHLHDGVSISRSDTLEAAVWFVNPRKYRREFLRMCSIARGLRLTWMDQQALLNAALSLIPDL